MPPLLDKVAEYCLKRSDLELVLVFGSYADGRHHESSDLDLAVASHAPMSTDTLVALTQDFERLSGRPCDVIDLSQAHGAALQVPLVRGKWLLLRNHDLYENLIKRMWRERDDSDRILQTVTEIRAKRWRQFSATLILEKKDTVLRCLLRISQKMPASLQELQSDPDAQDIMAINIERAVQACIDIAAHVIAYSAIPAAGTASQSFIALEQAGILSHSVAIRMQKAVGLRNLLVHEYQKTDWSIVWTVANKHLKDFSDFLDEVSRQIP